MSSPLQPGLIVGAGRFTLVKPLGRGGMGEVWLAQDERLNEPVALKFLPSEIRGDPVALDDLRRETARSHKLSHPNIVRIHDLHEDPDGMAFIVMEYVDGPTLAALRLQQPSRVLAWDYLRPMVKQLCAALDYAHNEMVIHRDLKPANMMVDSRGHLKLADFGIAAVASDSMSRISVRHSTSGTLPYMSPQQVTGKRPLATDDIYALGATLYELLTSKPPFYAGDLTHQVLHEPPEPIEERLAVLGIENPVPSGVAALVMACLAKEPGQRPQSARVVAEGIGLELDVKPSRESLAAALFPQTPTSPAAAVADWPAGKGCSTPTRLGRNLAAVGIVVLVMAGAFWLRTWCHRGDKSNAPSAAEVPALAAPAGDLKPSPSGAPPAAAVSPQDSTTHPPIPKEHNANAAEVTDLSALGGTFRFVKSSNTALTTGMTVSANNATKAKAPELVAGRAWTNSLGMRLVPVPGTKVLFSIWDTRVQDFAAFVQDTGYDATEGTFSLRRDGWKARGDTWQHPGFDQGPTHPVCGVSWDDGQAFCRWLTEKEMSAGLLATNQTYRLPAGSEWSTAVGARKYPWGDQWPPPSGAGNYAGSEAVDAAWPRSSPTLRGYRDGYARTSPVGSFAANSCGLFDMGGNVYQWCDGGYAGTAGYGVALRGGSWCDYDPLLLSSAFNPRVGRNVRMTHTGFRCVLAGSLETTNRVSTGKVPAQTAPASDLKPSPSGASPQTPVSPQHPAIYPVVPAEHNANAVAPAATERHPTPASGGAKASPPKPR